MSATTCRSSRSGQPQRRGVYTESFSSFAVHKSITFVESGRFRAPQRSLKEQKMQTITPKVAREYIDRCNHDPERMKTLMRPIRENWVDVLADRMRNGQFMPSATIVLAHSGADTYLVNGNHTLRAIERSGIPQKLPIIHHQVPTIDGVRQLYATYDRGLSRSMSDSLRAYGATESLGLPIDEVNYLAAAVRFMLADMGDSSQRVWGRKISDDSLLQMMVPWALPYIRLKEALKETDAHINKMILRRRPVLTVALITVVGQPSRAIEFWEAVKTGEGLYRTSSALRLREYLMMYNTSGRSGITGAKAPSETLSRYVRTVAYCWNKWYDNEPIATMRVPSGAVVINGCKHVELPRLPEA